MKTNDPSLQAVLDKLKRTGKVDENLIPDPLLELFYARMENVRPGYGNDGMDLSDDELENLRKLALFNLALRPGGEVHAVTDSGLVEEPVSVAPAVPVESRRLRRSARPRERRDRRRSSRSPSRGGDSGDPDLADEPEPPSERGAA